jgi:DmsE family decaheme c-type cytochrome
MSTRTITILSLAACVLFSIAAPAATPDDDVPAALKQDAICTRCHDETERTPVLSIYRTPHGVKADSRTPTCQSCHGQSEQHVSNPQGTDPRPLTEVKFGRGTESASQNEACLTCHTAGQRAHWQGSEHQRSDLACASCHQVHAQRDRVLAKETQVEVCTSCHQTQGAQIHRISTHPILAGQMGCSDCHNPHGSLGPKLMAKDSINETCYSCHADRRGPFLWEHSPVSENCTTCHTPHGSNNAPLLVKRTPWICQDCHTQDHARDVNSGANLPDGNLTTVNGQLPIANQAPRQQMNGRNCLACHPMVHGSNHPAGAKFSR